MQAKEDRDSLLARFMEGPALLARTLAGVKDSDLDTAPPGGGWTVRQIVHHIVDGDDIWKSAIKMAMGNDEAVFSLEWYRAYPQDSWAQRWAYAQRPVDASLALLAANRGHLRQLLETVPNAWDRIVRVRKPDDGIETVTVGFIIEMQTDHLEHHAKRIASVGGAD